MPETSEMHLVQELRVLDTWIVSIYMPEWEKDAYGKPLALGQRSKLSVQEQR